MGLLSDITSKSTHRDEKSSSLSHPNSEITHLPPAYPTAPAPLQFPVASGSAPSAAFACLHLARSDRVRLIGFPDNVIPAVNDAIIRVWVSGVQKAGAYEYGGYEWKLSGNPWYGSGYEAIPSRRLMIHILHALAAVGWELHFAVDLSKKQLDKDTLFFKAAAPVQRCFFSISFNESDKVRLIDSPGQGVTDGFVRAVTTAWAPGIQQTKDKEPGCLQIKLRGNPWWSSDGMQVGAARLMACAILSEMDAQGFELVGSVDMSVGGSDNNGDLDTWFFGNKLR